MSVEPTVVLTTVLAAAHIINVWLKDDGYREPIINNLTKVIQALCDILQPLKEPHNTQKLNNSVIALILEIAEVLTSTREHLTLRQAKKSFMTILGFLTPAKVTELLNSDREELNERITHLTLALQVPATHCIIDRTDEPGETSATPQDYLERVANKDVRDFWEQNFRQVFALDSMILPAICRWTNEPMDEHLENALMGVLDVEDIGVVVLKKFATFAGSGTIKEAISNMKLNLAIWSNSTSTATTLVTDDTPPTLVWVDAKETNNRSQALEAQQQGVNVIKISSTAVAKIWIKKNHAHLKQLENTNKLRFITDTARWEASVDWENQFMNVTAGERMLRFLRGSGFSSPVLVYCFTSIPMTQYVERFSHAGSTVKPFICWFFIRELATGAGIKGHRCKWEGFNRQNAYCSGCDERYIPGLQRLLTT